MPRPILQTKEIKKYFDTPNGMLHAVDGINLTINEGETMGVVGESGCGKSTLGRVIMKLLEATDGQILFKGQDITKYNKKEMRGIRKEIQIIFQDPYASLNPRKTISDIIAEPIIVTDNIKDKKTIQSKVTKLMNTVGLSRRLINAYPHELDGGRRQRVGIARALSLDPKFIVCDEPVSALDVSIQAQILNLLMDLQEEMGLSYMFITHDLSVVKHISDRIAVMYLGQCVEEAPSDELFVNPKHPYTKALLKSIPIPNVRLKNKVEIIRGEVVSPIEPKPGCRFAQRCGFATNKCIGSDIAFKEIEEDHFVACALFNGI